MEPDSDTILKGPVLNWILLNVSCFNSNIKSNLKEHRNIILSESKASGLILLTTFDMVINKGLSRPVSMTKLALS